MDLKTFAIETLKFTLFVVGTTVTAYAGVKLAQKIYGPIEVTIKDKK